MILQATITFSGSQSGKKRNMRVKGVGKKDNYTCPPEPHTPKPHGKSQADKYFRLYVTYFTTAFCILQQIFVIFSRKKA